MSNERECISSQGGESPERPTVVGRYWLFANHNYYPQGGLCDFHGSFASVEEAVEEVSSLGLLYCEDWWHIVDIKKQEVIQDGVWR